MTYEMVIPFLQAWFKRGRSGTEITGSRIPRGTAPGDYLKPKQKMITPKPRVWDGRIPTKGYVTVDPSRPRLKFP